MEINDIIAQINELSVNIELAQQRLADAWNPPSIGSKKREKMPSSYFLLPSKRKFPYKTKSGKISCQGLRAAMSRAAQHGYTNVYNKAKRLYNKYCKKSDK